MRISRPPRCRGEDLAPPVLDAAHSDGGPAYPLPAHLCQGIRFRRSCALAWPRGAAASPARTKDALDRRNDFSRPALRHGRMNPLSQPSATVTRQVRRSLRGGDGLLTVAASDFSTRRIRMAVLLDPCPPTCFGVWSHIMYSSMSSGKPTPPRNRRFIAYYY